MKLLSWLYLGTLTAAILGWPVVAGGFLLGALAVIVGAVWVEVRAARPPAE